MNDDSTSGSSAGGGGMNGMEQASPGAEQAPETPSYIPLSTKPQQMPGGSGGGAEGDPSALGEGADDNAAGGDSSESEQAPPGGANLMGGAG